MLREKKTFSSIILFIFLFAVGLSLFTNIPALQKNFLFADEATYFMMTESLVYDGDIQYTRRDLIRYYKAFDAGPMGIFLKIRRDEADAASDTLFYAKSFSYPLFAVPFVLTFGSNGFLVFHALLLYLILLMGYRFFSSLESKAMAFLAVFTFIFASAAAVYFLWLSPDFFNFFLVFATLFLWLYKHTRVPGDSSLENPGRLERFLHSAGSDYLACVLAGIAVYSKPPNIALMGPIVLYALLKRQIVRPLLMTGFFLLIALISFGINHFITGDWNYQGGERKTFYGEGGYPLEKEHLTFDRARGGEMTAEGYMGKHRYYPRVYFLNLFYYFFGRFSGIMWYFFPAVLALFLFFRRKKKLYQWLIFIALAGEILIYIIFMPDNFAGGGGALANRYFLSIYPLFFFLMPFRLDIRDVGVAWGVAAVFIAQILVNPLQHSHFPATHAKKFPFKLLPAELTLVNELPTNTNPAARRQEFGTKYSWLYFLDDNFHPRTTSELERNGFWTRGPRRAEMILKTWYPIKSVAFHLLNNPRMQNTITVSFAGETQSITLGYRARGTLTFTPKRVFRMNQWIHLYQLSVQADKGSIPHFETEQSDEKRFLGVFFELEIIPVYMPD